MEVRSMHFQRRVVGQLADPVVQSNLKRVKGKFVTARAAASAAFGDFETLRQTGEKIRNRVLQDLDLWLEEFERNASARGTQVLWAKDGDEVCRLVIEIAGRHGVKKATKSKSMLSEEAGLNQALEAAGIQPVETDLGEYILQINDNEPPSHIIAPVIHKSKEEISELFARVHQRPRKTEINEMTREAREMLRSHFVSADMGISGANFLVAETGSVALVTNEGNGRMCTTLPKVHVAITGIEKVIPTLEDLTVLLRLLTRSATGQPITNYVSVLTGPRRAEDSDGPDHNYVILVDNGRSSLLRTDFQDMLRCIRCGACMNHCPVYQTIGGHSYGWVYPGPMGSILTPLYVGIENALDLPHAATLCNQCGVVCPVRIPLPELLRKLREKQTEGGMRPRFERIALTLWAWVASRPMLYSLGTRFGVRYLKWLAGDSDRIGVLGVAPEWTHGRDFPAPEGRTFRELYAERTRQ